MGDSEIKEVKFSEFCPQCKHWKEGLEIPYCDSCMEEFVRRGTFKPAKFEEKSGT